MSFAPALAGALSLGGAVASFTAWVRVKRLEAHVESLGDSMRTMLEIQHKQNQMISAQLEVDKQLLEYVQHRQQQESRLLESFF